VLLETIKERIKTALKSGNNTEKSVLRVVLGEVQKKYNANSDDDVQKVIRKIMESNAETLMTIKVKAVLESSKDEVEKNILLKILGIQKEVQKLPTDEEVEKTMCKVAEIKPDDSRYATLEQENVILNSLLPKLWNADDIEAFLSLLNFEIKNAVKEGQATGIAMKALKAASAPVDGNTVKQVVFKIRGA
jgi:uncharacterized protein YqeY